MAPRFKFRRKGSRTEVQPSLKEAKKESRRGLLKWVKRPSKTDAKPETQQSREEEEITLDPALLSSKPKNDINWVPDSLLERRRQEPPSVVNLQTDRNSRTRLSHAGSDTTTETDSDGASESSSPEDSPEDAPRTRTIRFADEIGKQIEEIREIEGRVRLGRLIVMMLHTIDHVPELVDVGYLRDGKDTVNDLLLQLPKLAENPALQKQQFVGLCRMKRKSCKMAKTKLLNDFHMKKFEVVAAYPQTFSKDTAFKRAEEYLNKPAMGVALKRRMRAGLSALHMINSNVTESKNEARVPKSKTRPARQVLSSAAKSSGVLNTSTDDESSRNSEETNSDSDRSFDTEGECRKMLAQAVAEFESIGAEALVADEDDDTSKDSEGSGSDSDCSADAVEECKNMLAAAVAEYEAIRSEALAASEKESNFDAPGASMESMLADLNKMRGQESEAYEEEEVSRSDFVGSTSRESSGAIEECELMLAAAVEEFEAMFEAGADTHKMERCERTQTSASISLATRAKAADLSHAECPKSTKAKTTDPSLSSGKKQSSRVDVPESGSDSNTEEEIDWLLTDLNIMQGIGSRADIVVKKSDVLPKKGPAQLKNTAVAEPQTQVAGERRSTERPPQAPKPRSQPPLPSLKKSAVNVEKSFVKVPLLQDSRSQLPVSRVNLSRPPLQHKESQPHTKVKQATQPLPQDTQPRLPKPGTKQAKAAPQHKESRSLSAVSGTKQLSHRLPQQKQPREPSPVSGVKQSTVVPEHKHARPHSPRLGTTQSSHRLSQQKEPRPPPSEPRANQLEKEPRSHLATEASLEIQESSELRQRHHDTNEAIARRLRVDRLRHTSRAILVQNTSSNKQTHYQGGLPESVSNNSKTPLVRQKLDLVGTSSGTDTSSKTQRSHMGLSIHFRIDSFKKASSDLWNKAKIPSSPQQTERKAFISKHNVKTRGQTGASTAQEKTTNSEPSTSQKTSAFPARLNNGDLKNASAVLWKKAKDSAFVQKQKQILKNTKASSHNLSVDGLRKASTDLFDKARSMEMSGLGRSSTAGTQGQSDTKCTQSKPIQDQRKTSELSKARAFKSTNSTISGQSRPTEITVPPRNLGKSKTTSGITGETSNEPTQNSLKARWKMGVRSSTGPLDPLGLGPWRQVEI